MLSSEYKNGFFLSRALQCPTEILFSLHVVSDSGTPWTAAHQASLSPGVCSNSCLLSPWCHPTNSFSAAPFFCLPSFPASEFFPVSQVFTSGGQSIGASASVSVLPMNIHGWFPSGCTGMISWLFKGLTRVSLTTTILKHQFFGSQPFRWSKFHILTWLLEKPLMFLKKTI